MKTKELATRINKLSKQQTKDIIRILKEEIIDPLYTDKERKLNNPNIWDLLSLQYMGKTQIVTESSLNRIINFHMNKEGTELNSWAVITTNKIFSHCPPYERISRNSKKDKQNQFKQKITAMGYSYINVFGGFYECTIPGIDINKCPKDKLIETHEKPFFIPKITFKDILSLSHSLITDLDWNNDNTKQEKGRFIQDSFIYAGKETKYDAYLFDGKTGDQEAKFATVKIKKGMYGYTGVKNKYFTLEVFTLPAGSGEQRIQEIFKKFVNDETKYSHYLVYEMFKLPINDLKKLLTLLK